MEKLGDLGKKKQQRSIEQGQANKEKQRQKKIERNPKKRIVLIVTFRQEPSLGVSSVATVPNMEGCEQMETKQNKNRSEMENRPVVGQRENSSNNNNTIIKTNDRFRATRLGDAIESANTDANSSAQPKKWQ